MMIYIQALLLLCVSVSAMGCVSQPTYSLVDNLGVALDHTLVQIMNIKNGVFVEVGAFDGVEQSNTKLLEECYGWTGVLIEPSAVLFPRLCQNRPRSHCFQCALGSFEEDGLYGQGDFDGNPMASLKGERGKQPAEYLVLIRSLQSILDELQITSVNFLSLDTEGYELNILKGIDFAKTHFGYMLIEIYKDQYDEIIALLDSKGYDMIGCLSNYNPVDNPMWDGTHNDYLFVCRNN